MPALRREGGALLAEHFPRRTADKNELSDAAKRG